MAENVKITWAPRTFNIVPGINKPNEYQGVGWVLNDNGLFAGISRRSIAPPHPGGMTPEWFHTISRFLGYSLWFYTSGGGNKLYEGDLGLTTLTEKNWLGGTAVPNSAGLDMVDFGGQYFFPSASGVLGETTTAPAGPYGYASPFSASHAYFRLEGHLSRLVGANILTAPAKVGWCVAGNPFDWVGAGSGSADLIAEFGPEGIMGVKVVDNVLVLLGRKAIVFGYPTGVSTPAYRFETILRLTDGCVDPYSLAQFGRMLLYKGDRGIYKFENRQQSLISDVGMTKQLSGMYLTNYRGVIEHSYNAPNTAEPTWMLVPTPHYLLVPIKYHEGLAHSVLSYDLLQNSWSRLFVPRAHKTDPPLSEYNIQYKWAASAAEGREPARMLTNNVDPFNVHVVDSYTTTTAGTQWARANAQSGSFQVGDSSRAYVLDRVLLTYRYMTPDLQPANITVTVRMQGDSAATTKQAPPRSGWNNANAPTGEQVWFDFRQLPAGQMCTFHVEVFLKPGSHLELLQLEAFFTDAGEFRELNYVTI